MKKKKVYDLTTVLDFGRYQGNTIKYLYDFEYSYFKWFINTLNLDQMTDAVKNLSKK